jgi:hypothetical protein
VGPVVNVEMVTPSSAVEEALRFSMVQNRACGGIGWQRDSVMGARREGEGLVHVGDGNNGGRQGEAKRRAWRLNEQSNEGESETEK